MTLKEIMEKKKEYGYSNSLIAELSGIPLGTVEKIMSGRTKAPRYLTLQALNRIFSGEEVDYTYDNGDESITIVKEPLAPYTVGTSAMKEREMTIDDYLALPDDRRVELIDGVFYDMAAPTTIHQMIGGLIYTEFQLFVRSNKGLCIPFSAPTDVQLDCDNKTIVQPDVMIVCDRKKITRPRIYGAPDMVVEVLSPSNWYHDTVRKLKKYKNAGVREYWIVLPDEKKILVYVFEKSPDPTIYTFEDKVPVAIWDGQCIVDFKMLYEEMSFMYEN